MSPVESAIAAVTVFPDRARVTRQGRVAVAAGEQTVAFGPLPLGLLRDSVRVSGTGAATVLGVDVVTRRQARPANAARVELERRWREIEIDMSAIDVANAVAETRERHLERTAARTSPLPADFDAWLTEVKTGIAERNRQRADLATELAAVQRQVGDLRRQNLPDELLAEVTLEAAADGEIALELSYLTTGASWHSTYDLRLADSEVALAWYGMISQNTGEDWPECRLALSTARPADSLAVPELDPWYIDRRRPVELLEFNAGAAYGAAAPVPAPAGGAPHFAAVADAAEIAEETAVAEQGPAAATYTPQRPIAVRADGTSHRTVVAKLVLESRLDHVTAPVHSEAATLRATVRNNSSHTLPPGSAALFHDGDFVGSTDVEAWAPDEERELALGLDDRVRVERALVKRSASKATLGSSRRIDAEYRITVANHSPRTIHLTVLDQVPVSRDAQITVKETTAAPAPADRSELGILTWKTDLAPNAAAGITFGYRVETPKGIDLTGWRD